ncbi:MAG: hypothetical protein V1809_05245 [Planctomycetota bacterium]
MRKTNIMLAVAALAFAICSCNPESKNPLSDPSTAKHDSRLTGTWVGQVDDIKSRDVVWLHISEIKGSMTKFIQINTDKGNDINFYKAFSTTIGNETYLNIKPDVPEEGFLTEEKRAEIETSNYLLAKYAISKDGILRIWLMTNAISKAIENGQIKGIPEKNETQGNTTVHTNAEITDSSENLVTFLSTTDHQGLFGLALKLRRVNTPPPAWDGEESKQESLKGKRRPSTP